MAEVSAVKFAILQNEVLALKRKLNDGGGAINLSTSNLSSTVANASNNATLQKAVAAHFQEEWQAAQQMQSTENSSNDIKMNEKLEELTNLVFNIKEELKQTTAADTTPPQSFDHDIIQSMIRAELAMNKDQEERKEAESGRFIHLDPDSVNEMIRQALEEESSKTRDLLSEAQFWGNSNSTNSHVNGFPDKGVMSEMIRSAVKEQVKESMSQMKLAHMIQQDSRRDEDQQRYQRIDESFQEQANLLKSVQNDLREAKERMEDMRQELCNSKTMETTMTQTIEDLGQELHQTLQEKIDSVWKHSQELEDQRIAQYESRMAELNQICNESKIAKATYLEKTFEDWDNQFADLLSFFKLEMDDHNVAAREIECSVESIKKQNELLRLQFEALSTTWENKMNSFMHWVREPVENERLEHEDLRTKMQETMHDTMEAWKVEFFSIKNMVEEQGRVLLVAEERRAELQQHNNTNAYNFQESYQNLMQEAQARVDQLVSLNEELSQGKESLVCLDQEWKSRVHAWTLQLDHLESQVQVQTEDVKAAQNASCQAEEKAQQAIDARDRAEREKVAAFDECVQFVMERNEETRKSAQEKVNMAQADYDLAIQQAREACNEAIHRAKLDHDKKINEKEQALRKVQQLEVAARQTARDTIEAAAIERARVDQSKKKALREMEQSMKDQDEATRKAAREAILAAEKERDRVISEKQTAIETYQQLLQSRESATRKASQEAIQAAQDERDVAIQKAKDEYDAVVSEKMKQLEECKQLIQKHEASTLQAQMERDQVIDEKKAAVADLEKRIKDREDAARNAAKESVQAQIDRDEAIQKMKTEKEAAIKEMEQKIVACTKATESAAKKAIAATKNECTVALEEARIQREKIIQEKDTTQKEYDLKIEEMIQNAEFERTNAAHKSALESMRAQSDYDDAVRSIKAEKTASINAMEEKIKAHTASIEKAAAESVATAKAECTKALEESRLQRDMAIQEKEKTLEMYEAKIQNMIESAESERIRACQEAAELSRQAQFDRDELIHKMMAEKETAIELMERKINSFAEATESAAKKAIAATNAECTEALKEAHRQRDMALQEKEMTLLQYDEKIQEMIRTAESEQARMVQEKNSALEQMEQMMKERDMAEVSLSIAQAERDQAIEKIQAERERVVRKKQEFMELFELKMKETREMTQAESERMKKEKQAALDLLEQKLKESELAAQERIAVTQTKLDEAVAMLEVERGRVIQIKKKALENYERKIHESIQAAQAVRNDVLMEKRAAEKEVFELKQQREEAKQRLLAEELLLLEATTTTVQVQKGLEKHRGQIRDTSIQESVVVKALAEARDVDDEM